MVRLARKELREVLRDRRTIITLILMPLLVYPLLGVVMRKGLLSNLESLQEPEIHVCLVSERDQAIFSQVMEFSQFVINEQQAMNGPDETPDPLDELTSNEDEAGIQFRFVPIDKPDPTADDVRFMVEQEYADVGIVMQPVDIDTIRYPGQQRFRMPDFYEWHVIRRSDSALSDRAVDVITERLDIFNEQYVDQVLRFHNLSTAKPASVTEVVVTGEGSGRYSFVTFIPLVLVLMTMTGAVYPAIDVTAGERERGTMEILMAAPVSRLKLLCAKFLAVLVVALLTATVNLTSMFITLFSLGLDEVVLGDAPWMTIPMIAALMIVFASFFSAVLLSLTSVARSFKEAQAYLIPLMLISLTPGVFSLMPSLKMNTLLAVTPLANTVLMARDLLHGEINALMFSIVLFSTAVYGLLALSVAARVFGSDAVLYGSSGSWSEMFGRQASQSSSVSLTTVALSLAVIVPLFLTANSLPGRFDLSLTGRFAVSALVAVTIFAIVPAGLCLVTRTKLRTAFSFRQSSPAFFIGAVLLGFSLWALVYEINLMVFGSRQLSVLEKLHEQLAADLGAVSWGTKLICLAIVPAVTEELFFRGFIQNSFHNKLKPVLAIAGAALLFGAFHVIVRDALFIERLIPSTLMGLVLGVSFYRSGSVFPGMLLHVLHNGLLISIGHFEEQLSQWGVGTQEQQHLPALWLAGAAVAVIIGMTMLFTSDRRFRSQ